MKWLIPLCFFVNISAHAAEPAADSKTPLSPELVSSWLDSAEALQKWGEEHGIRGHPMFEGKLDDLSELMVLQLREQGIYREVKGFLSERGFPTPENWADTGERIVTAMGAVTLGSQTAQYAAALEKLSNGPGLSPEAKEALSANLALVKELHASFTTVSEQDKRVVTPFVEQFRALTLKRAQLRERTSQSQP